MNRIAKAVGAALCAGVTLVGCSAVTANKGGDTSCGEFKKMEVDDQADVISKMLKDDKGKEASNLEVSATRISAVAFCNTLGTDSSKVKDINTG